jgi:hypothetical protein
MTALDDKTESPFVLYAEFCKDVIGARLIEVRHLTDSELEILGWEGNNFAPIMIFDNGHGLIASMDAELNGSGHLEPCELG